MNRKRKTVTILKMRDGIKDYNRVDSLRLHTHTHTHKNIYIYIYTRDSLSLSLSLYIYIYIYIYIDLLSIKCIPTSLQSSWCLTTNLVS